MFDFHCKCNLLIRIHLKPPEEHEYSASRYISSQWLTQREKQVTFTSTEVMELKKNINSFWLDGLLSRYISSLWLALREKQVTLVPLTYGTKKKIIISFCLEVWKKKNKKIQENVSRKFRF